MKSNHIITLLTDFGLSDGYVAAMKGVILSHAPAVRLVDISHSIERHNILSGAFVLASVEPYFPVGTVHLVVIDPGVGSERDAIALRTNRAWFVGPDNGVLWKAAGQDIVEATSITSVPGFSGPISSTFHGRDLFSPAAAYLSHGGEMRRLGDPKTSILQIPFPDIRISPEGIRGQVIRIDSFGNATTNISRHDLPAPFDETRVEIGSTKLDGIVNCYADVKKGELCALIGSDELLEIAVSQGSAAEVLNVREGQEVFVFLSALESSPS